MDDIKLFLKKSYKVEIDSDELIDLSNSILESYKLKDNRNISINLFEWVRDQIRYEIVKVVGALGTYKRKSGACIDKSSLLIALLRINKIPSRYITLKAFLITNKPISEKSVDHCAVQAFIDNEWILFDPTFDPRFDSIFPKASYNNPGWWDRKKSIIFQKRAEISKLEMDITSINYEVPTPWKRLIKRIKKKNPI